jgi:hypothetical protein
MYKIKLIFRGELDGQTPVTTTPPTFRLVEGWNEAEIATPSGLIPAGLWGQVPAGDPYLVHACMLTTQPIDPQVIFEIRSGVPIHSRVQFTPSADNTRITLVRPSDEFRLVAPPQALIKLELLIESIGGTNELGSRLHEWADAAYQSRDTGVRAVNFAGSAQLAAWLGKLHVIYDSAAGGNNTLPPRSTVPLDALLTVTRKAAGVPTLVAANGDTFAGGVPTQAVTRSAIVMNNGDQWTWAGT